MRGVPENSSLAKVAPEGFSVQVQVRAASKLSKHSSESEKQEARLEAKAQLLAILKSDRKLILKLGLSQQASDLVIIKALAKYDSVYEILRSLGLSIAESSKAADLMPQALAALPKKGGKTGKNLGVKALKGFLLVLILIIIGLAGNAVYQATQATAGWLQGTCSITTFTNQTCNQGLDCNFEVSVRGGGQWTSMRAWKPPVVFSTGKTGKVVNKFDHDALRCCNDFETGAVGSCCDMWDTPFQSFCDNWGYRFGPDGKRCHEGSWPCLFKLEDGPEKRVKELTPYTPVDLVVLIAPIAALGALFLMILCLWRLVDRCTLVYPLVKRMMRLLEGAFGDDEDDEENALAGDEAPAGAERAQPESEKGAEPLPSENQAAYYPEPANTNGPGTTRSVQGSKGSTSIREFMQLDPNAAGKPAGQAQHTLREAGFSKNRPGTAQSSIPSLAGTQDAHEPSLPGVVESPKEDRPRSRYPSWEQKPGGEDADQHPQFSTGDLARYAARAKDLMPSLLAPIIEPLDRPARPRSGKARQKRKQGQSADTPHAWAWAGQAVDGRHVSDIGWPAGQSASPMRPSTAMDATSSRRQSSSDRPGASHSHRRQPGNNLR
ncbi:unnamed protein product [Polarella glacialis]|uniref:Uncharacterized protein n=1 Tax=Polarella glacialis TaxID=89957 RepID=A0A813I0L6_POLGL|nr:unnamed protein product [Polarella glacialis]